MLPGLVPFVGTKGSEEKSEFNAKDSFLNNFRSKFLISQRENLRSAFREHLHNLCSFLRHS